MTTFTAVSTRRAQKRSSHSVRTGPLLAPAVGLLLAWMIVPLALTLWFSVQYYNLLDPLSAGFAGLDNYSYVQIAPGNLIIVEIGRAENHRLHDRVLLSFNPLDAHLFD